MATLQETMAEFYIGLFDRAPDQAGLEHWISDYNRDVSVKGDRETKIDIIANMIALSDFADADSNEDFVNFAYEALFNKVADTEGFNHWMGDLTIRGASREEVLLNMIDAAKSYPEGKALLENKLATGFYWMEKNPGTFTPETLPDTAFECIDVITADPASVDDAKEIIDGTDPVEPPVTNQTFNLDDDKKVYGADVKGGAGNDTYNITDFKTGSSIDGGEGSDTVNFVDYADGVEVDLRAGTADGGLKITWVENIIGTEGDDTLIGNHDANVITMMGGADTIDAYIGDDLIIAADMDNVTDSTINGASGNDTLKILAADINLDDVAAATASIEVIKVGYDGVEEEEAAATVTLDGDAFDPSAEGIKEIHANTTKSLDRKGVEIFDEIVSTTQNLDLTGIALYNFERVSVTQQVDDAALAISTAADAKAKQAIADADGATEAQIAAAAAAQLVADAAANDDSTITIGANTLTMLKEVVGVATDGDAAVAATELVLVGKDGDVFDMSAPKLINIATLNAPVNNVDDLAAIKATMIMGQKQFNELALAGDFSKVTLQLKGQGVDMTTVDLGGVEAPFKEIVFGANDTKSLLLSAVAIDVLNGAPAEDAVLDDPATVGIDESADAVEAIVGSTIVGSEYNSDMLSIRGDDEPVDMTGLITTSIESFDFEGITDVTLDNMVLHGKDAANTPTNDVKNIAGDSELDTVILNGNAPLVDEETGDETIVALDLGGIKLRDVGALGDVAGSDQNCFSIDTGTILGTTDSAYGVLQLAEAGTYDLSGLKNTVTDESEEGLDDGEVLTVEGSTGDDVVKGTAGSAAYVMDAGNDTVHGGDSADNIEGGAGNDTLNGGKGDDDLIDGGAGNDNINGGEGADTIVGGTGVDSLTGGLGDDNFLFTSGDTGMTKETVDCINDFSYVDGNQDAISFSFYTDTANQTVFAAGEATAGVASGTVFFADMGADFDDEATLEASANAALQALFDDKELEVPTDALDALIVQFECDGEQYLAVDAYLSDTIAANFIVKVAGVAADALADAFDADQISITGIPAPIV